MVLQDIVLNDERGQAVRLGDLWRDQPAVLIFLRHYACVFCRAHAVQLHRSRKKFDKAGARLVAIGQGTPEQAAGFKEDQGVEIPLLVDPDRASYQAAGAKVATMYELLGPRVIARALAWTITSRWRLGSIAVHQGRPVDHPAQLGGVLVVARDGSVRYAHMSEDASDNPPVSEVLAAVRAIRPHAEASS
jgi:peroxiredoxin